MGRPLQTVLQGRLQSGAPPPVLNDQTTFDCKQVKIEGDYGNGVAGNALAFAQRCAAQLGIVASGQRMAGENKGSHELHAVLSRCPPSSSPPKNISQGTSAEN